MIEFNKALLETFGRVVVEASKEDSEDCGEVLLNGGTGSC